MARHSTLELDGLEAGKKEKEDPKAGMNLNFPSFFKTHAWQHKESLDKSQNYSFLHVRLDEESLEEWAENTQDM